MILSSDSDDLKPSLNVDEHEGFLRVCSLPSAAAFHFGGSSQTDIIPEENRSQITIPTRMNEFKYPSLTLDHEGLPMYEFPLRHSANQIAYVDFVSKKDQQSHHGAAFFAVLSSTLRTVGIVPPLFDENGVKRFPENPNVVTASQSFAKMATEKKIRLDDVDWSYVTRKNYNLGLFEVVVPCYAVKLYTSNWGEHGCLHSYNLLPNERGICVQSVRIHVSSLRNVKNWGHFIAVGTGIVMPEGEDRPY